MSLVYCNTKPDKDNICVHKCTCPKQCWSTSRLHVYSSQFLFSGLPAVRGDLGCLRNSALAPSKMQLLYTVRVLRVPCPWVHVVFGQGALGQPQRYAQRADLALRRHRAALSWNIFRSPARNRHAQNVAAKVPMAHDSTVPDIACKCKCSSLAKAPAM